MGIIKLVPFLGYPVLYINTPSNMMQRKLAVESSMRKSEMRRVLAVQTSVCTVCVQGCQRVKVSTEAYSSAFGFQLRFGHLAMKTLTTKEALDAGKLLSRSAN